MTRGTLAQRTALVTGGSRGIGRAIALALAREGAKIGITYVRRSAEAEETLGLAAEAGGTAVAFRADVGSGADIDALLAQVAERLGDVDILVNNAGTHADGLIFELDDAKFSSVMDVNLLGAVRLTRAMAKGMMLRRWGRILNVSSVSGHWGGRGKSNYAASKGALDAFSRAVAVELASRGITVNAIAPGMIETEMTEAVRARGGDKLLERIPARRFGRPEDVAAVALFLASDAAAYVTGQVITVDGGLSVQ